MLTSRGKLVKGLLSLVSIHSREPVFAVLGARFLGSTAGLGGFVGSSCSVAFRFLVELGANVSSS